MPSASRFLVLMESISYKNPPLRPVLYSVIVATAIVMAAMSHLSAQQAKPKFSPEFSHSLSIISTYAEVSCHDRVAAMAFVLLSLCRRSSSVMMGDV